jgi:hypothetical protein
VETEPISRKLALSNACRSFNLIAKASSLAEFATLDAAQAKLAEAAGSTVLTLPE